MSGASSAFARGVESSTRGSRWPGLVVMAMGVSTIAFGAIVIAGWHTGNPGLVRAWFHGAPTSYGLAVVVLLCGAGLIGLATGRRPLAYPGAVVGIVTGGLVIASKFTPLRPELWVGPLSGRLPLAAAGGHALLPTVSLQFVLIGVALALLALRRQVPWRPATIGTIGAAVSALGLTGAFAHLSGNTPGMLLADLTRGALQSAIAITGCGIGLIGAAWAESRARQEGIPRWAPMLVGAAGFTLTLVICQVEVAERLASDDQLSRAIGEEMADRIASGVASTTLPLERMARGWEGRTSLSGDAWEAEAELLVSNLGTFRAVAWGDPSRGAPRVATQDATDIGAARDLMRQSRAGEGTSAARDLARSVASRPVAWRNGDRAIIVSVRMGRGAQSGGWIAGIIDARTLVEPWVSPAQLRDHRVELVEDGERLYAGDGPGAGPRPPLETERTFDLLGRSWRIEIWPALPAAASGRAMPAITLAVGALLAALLWLAAQLAHTSRLREREAREARQRLAEGIGQWRLVEREQRMSEERFQMVARATNDAVWSWDLISGELWWNSSAFALFGLSPDEHRAGMHSKEERVHPKDRDRVVASMQAAIDGGSETWASDYRFQRGDGTYAEVSDRAFIVHEAGRGARRVFGSMMDVTARKQAEEERDRFFMLSPDMLCIAGFDGFFKRLSPAWTTVLGYSVDELLSRPYVEFVHPDDRDITRSTAEQIEAGHDVASFENRYRTKSGEYRWFQWKTRTASDQGIVYATARDVTEQRRLSDELEAACDDAVRLSGVKSAFLANMSHEIRTPMNGVIGMSELLMSTPLTATQRRYADTIRASADALLTVLNDILDFSKLEAGKVGIAADDFDLTLTVEDALDLFAKRAQSKGLDLAGRVTPDVPVWVRGDASRVRQVLTNLIGNAIKFTERGAVTLEASLVEQTAARAVLRFEVKDTGIGISEEGRKALFFSFSQVDSSSTRRHGGTGLGLAICRQLVELMGGRIGVESQPGRGSTFWFTLPFEKSSAPVAPTGAGAVAGRRVLLVDGSPSSRDVLLRTLQAWGLEVREVPAGGGALEALRVAAESGAPFDVVVFDLYLPDIDGLALALAIRSSSRLGHPSLVMLTPMGSREEVSRVAGVSACLARPIKQSQLWECLLSLLDPPRAAAPAAGPALAAGEAWDRSESRATAVDLAAPAGTDAELARAPDAREAAACSVRGQRLLVVDDNPVNLYVALGQLEAHGHFAEVVSSGREALAAMERQSYDMILMDCQMPDLDGFETTEEIRKREGASRHTIVIAMTAYALEGDREKCLSAGMDDYLSKPIRGAALDRIIQCWLADGPAAPGGADACAVPAPAGSLVDMSLLRDAACDDTAKLHELIRLYFRNTDELLFQLHAEILAGSPEDVRRIAHRCAGSSASCGMLALVPGFRDLERMAHDGRLSQAPQVFAQLAARLEQIRLELHPFLGAAQAVEEAA
jgi:two-component system sensor histidine kinase/response regulator